ncbi:neutral amino acid transport system ATP-binding protein [Neobacillus niacini]|uniref:ABC transporter ATP-binding protein n=1 Tax=Neobacillus niacini TaxID=86668 RepID=UPI002863E6E6|nr:ABC transporter ATP-binding protein [Neobacillus niacini]MDR7079343.1 neutral amino acid transport system ATP-binding protein [Neobacillus niacini]
MLQVKGLSKNFGGVQAVKDVTLEVNQGEIVGLIGPNGAGKTTLFNMISLFLPSNSGQITFLNEKIDTATPDDVVEKGLLRTFQTPVGFPKLSLLENLMVVPPNEGEGIFSTFLFRKKIIQREQEHYEKVCGLLRQFNLFEKRNELAENLSAAELKLLELCRQLMASPKIMLLDEPASGVNPVMLDKMVQHILRLRSEGMTFLVIDHNLGFIYRICDRIYCLANGELIASGTPEEISNNEQVKSVYLGAS